MGNDFYESPREIEAVLHDGGTPLGVGANTHIQGAIIDKNCRIGGNVRIVNSAGVESTEENQYGMIRDGIVVTTKGAVIPTGTTI